MRGTCVLPMAPDSVADPIRRGSYLPDFAKPSFLYFNPRFLPRTSFYIISFFTEQSLPWPDLVGKGSARL